MKIRIAVEEFPKAKGIIKPLLPFETYDQAVDWLRRIERLHRERVDKILSELKENKE